MEVAILLDVLDDALPGFRKHAESEENDFGTERVHSLFSCATQFVRERPVSTESWKQLAWFINEIVGGQDDDLDTAVCSCFLENLAERDHPWRTLLGEKARTFWMAWEPQED